MNTNIDLQIGSIILAKLAEKERSVSWLARQIHRDESNLGRTLKNNSHLHTDLLLRISRALDEDFFALYSNILQNTIL